MKFRSVVCSNECLTYLYNFHVCQQPFLPPFIERINEKGGLGKVVEGVQMKEESWYREKRSNEAKQTTSTYIRNFMQYKIDKCVDPFCLMHFNSSLTIWRFCVMYLLYVFLFSISISFLSPLFARILCSTLLSLFRSIALLLLLLLARRKNSCSKKSNCIKLWFFDFLTTMATNWRKNAKLQ